MSQKQSEMGRAGIMGNETKLNMNNLCTQWSQQKFRYLSMPERFTGDTLKKRFGYFLSLICDYTLTFLPSLSLALSLSLWHCLSIPQSAEQY